MKNKDIAGFMLEDWYVLDNFAPFQIEWRGKMYSTSEHAYQSAHFFETNKMLAEQVRQCRSPKEAQDFANKNSSQDDPLWKQKKLSIMEEIIRCKLDQHSYIRDKLLATKDMYIVETNDKDEFWGWGKDHEGQNQLGKIWMKLRDEIAV